jgi:5,5'-dehydrodivanillate O-demethylase
MPELSLITAQDYVAVCGQGQIVNRSEENLSTSDAGVAFLRRIFLRELEAIQEGRPTKVWTSLEEMPDLPKPQSHMAAE